MLICKDLSDFPEGEGEQENGIHGETSSEAWPSGGFLVFIRRLPSPHLPAPGKRRKRFFSECRCRLQVCNAGAMGDRAALTSAETVALKCLTGRLVLWFALSPLPCLPPVS